MPDSQGSLDFDSTGTVQACDHACIRTLTQDAPVFKLPNEILESVFLLNATNMKDKLIKRSATTLASSHVCQQWRSIAIQFPEIWAKTINYNGLSIHWIRELLTRSRNSLLDVYYPDSNVDGYHVFPFLSLRKRKIRMEIMLNHAPRFRKLFYRPDIGAQDVTDLFYSRFLVRPAPNLEFFYLFNNPKNTITTPLFANHAPRLRYFFLKSAQFNYDCLKSGLWNFTELFVAKKHSWFVNPTVADWLQILSRMPSLRYLSIIGSIHEDNNGANMTVNLHKLDVLRIEGKFQSCMILIDHLSMPLRCGLMLSFQKFAFGIEQARLWTIIEQKLQLWDRNTPNRRCVYTYGGLRVNIGNRKMPSQGNPFAIADYRVLDSDRLTPNDPILSIDLYGENIDPLSSLLKLFKTAFIATTILDVRPGKDCTMMHELINICGLENVQTIYLGNFYHTLLLLQQFLDCVSELLPALPTINIVRGSELDEFQDQVADFVEWRRKHGEFIHIQCISYRDYLAELGADLDYNI